MNLYSDRDRRRLHVQPGITCIWQVSGRGDLPFSEQVRLDLDYIQNRSMLLDLKLLILTLPAAITGRGGLLGSLAVAVEAWRTRARPVTLHGGEPAGLRFGIRPALRHAPAETRTQPAFQNASAIALRFSDSGLSRFAPARFRLLVVGRCFNDAEPSLPDQRQKESSMGTVAPG